MLKRTEAAVDEKCLHVKPMLPDVNDPRERENRITEDRGVVFVIDIGGQLVDGTIHDGRTPDEEMARRCKNAGVMLL